MASASPSRVRVVNALGMLGTRGAASMPGGRHAAEDENPHYYPLKALDYIHGPEAERVINTSGAKVEDSGPRRPAGRNTGNSVC